MELENDQKMLSQIKWSVHFWSDQFFGLQAFQEVLYNSFLKCKNEKE